MPIFNKNFYFETSGIDYYCNNFSISDAIATKAYQNAKGNFYFISPIALWEILLTKKEIEREKIILFSQHIFEENLLKSPAEFIIQYINDGINVVQRPHSVFTNSHIGDTWKDICINKNKSIETDHDSLLSMSTYLRNISKKLHKIVNEIILNIEVKNDVFYYQEIIRLYYNTIQNEYGPFYEDEEKVIKISILLVNVILCFQIDLDPTPYKEFWNRLNISHPVDKVRFIFDNLRKLVTTGPFYLMAKMAFSQIKLGSKTNRGLLFDCLHSMYLVYLDTFVTNDVHFKNFSNVVNIYADKMIYLSEAKITQHQVRII